VIALVSSFVQPKRYESVAGVQIHPLVQALGPTGEQREFAIGVYETERFLETEIEVIRSHETLKWVVERLGLSTRWGAVQPERVLEILESMVQTEQVPETDLVRITVRHTSAGSSGYHMPMKRVSWRQPRGGPGIPILGFGGMPSSRIGLPPNTLKRS
jgi:uncharacterized protein involved in exopolysaccharide biosynthesis